MIKDDICPICQEKHKRLSFHVSIKHPKYAQEQHNIICERYRRGMTAEQISEMPDIIYAGKSGVVKVIAKYFSKEEIEEYRKKNISKTLLQSYAAGEREHIKEINTQRAKSEEGRRKNSEGLKKAYAEGRKKSWNLGLNKDIDERIKESSEKISQIMRLKYKNGELTTTFKSGEESHLWKEDRNSIVRAYRNNLDFSKKDRISLIEKFNHSCNYCKITSDILDEEKNLLNLNRNTLECDHIIPIKDGGEKDWKVNGQVLCSRCHIIKSLKEVCEKEKYTDIENKYNHIPALYLKNKFGGEILSEYNVWSKNDLHVFISPLTKKYAEYKYLHSDLKSQYKNLLIFFADEWNQKREITLSMIQNQLKESSIKIYARKTTCKEISLSEANQFLEQNHISGGSPTAFLCLGLYYQDELISVLTFKYPFTSKHKGKVEIARFASKLQHNVIGGFSKMLKFAISHSKLSKFEVLMTYADLRFGTGNVYQLNGFQLVGKTPLDYSYTNGYIRENRFKYRAQNGKSEKEISQEKGVYKVFGCGSYLFNMNLNK